MAGRMCSSFRRPPGLGGLVGALAASCGLALWPGGAGVAMAAPGWQTWLHPRDFTDLLVTDDDVWCATAEAGLLRFDRATHVFRPITREPGAIASNHLTSLAFDRTKRLWVGTAESGVSRLSADGSTWELVNAFDGLPGDSVTTITVVGDTLWIGARHGIALWDGRRVLGSLPDGNTVSFDTTFVLPAITGVVQLADTLWLATPRGVGYAHTTTNLADWRPANGGLPTLEADHLASDGQTLYAQSGGAVYQWEPSSAQWVAAGALGTVHSLREDFGTVLAGTEQGIWSHRAGETGFTLVPNSPVATPVDKDDPEPAVDPTGSTTYFAGSSAGLWEHSAASADSILHRPVAPPGNAYTNIVIDGARVYAATRDDGIGRWDGSDWFAFLPDGCFGACPNSFVLAAEVFAMLVDPRSQDPLGRKWVSCWGFAMDRFDDSGEPPLFTHFWTQGGDEYPHTLASAAAADSNGGRWFGMNAFNEIIPLGLDYYDATGAYAGTFGPESPNSLVRGGKIRALTVDKAGRIWVGYPGAANSEIDHFVGQPTLGHDFATVPLTTGLDIWSLVAHGDSIWALTDHDLRRIDRAGRPPRVVQTLKAPDGRPLGMRLMDVAPNGDVFVGTEEGVRWYRGDGTTRDFTTANSPLADNEVRAVAVEPTTGMVWFGTADGLNRFDPAYRPPTPPPLTQDSLGVYPNPATLTGLGVRLRLVGAAPGYVGGIYDLRGRLVRRFTTTETGHVFWDGRDTHGELVQPGVYFVRAEGGGRQARARFVLLR